jgi:hypothetical protein
MLHNEQRTVRKKESSLHRSLKFQYSGEGGSTEKLTGAYVCDACTSKGEYIEVQTGSFAPLREKAKTLTQNASLRIIHPIIVKKQIELYDTSGQKLHSRKSPKKGSIWDLFKVLVYAPELPLLKNLTVELALVDVVEKRVNDGSGSWRRKGVRIDDRLLEAWHHSVRLKGLKDYRQFVPFKKNELFTVRNLAEKAGINAALARKTLYALAKMGLVEKAGRQGRALVYRRSLS